MIAAPPRNPAGFVWVSPHDLGWEAFGGSNLIASPVAAAQLRARFPGWSIDQTSESAARILGLMLEQNLDGAVVCGHHLTEMVDGCIPQVFIKERDFYRGEAVVKKIDHEIVHFLLGHFALHVFVNQELFRSGILDLVLNLVPVAQTCGEAVLTRQVGIQVCVTSFKFQLVC